MPAESEYLSPDQFRGALDALADHDDSQGSPFIALEEHDAALRARAEAAEAENERLRYSMSDRAALRHELAEQALAEVARLRSERDEAVGLLRERPIRLYAVRAFLARLDAQHTEGAT